MKRGVASQENAKALMLRLLERGELRTDSDVDDFIEEHGLSPRDADEIIAKYNVQGTKCEGCKNAVFYPNMAPCCNCSRNKRDYFEK